MAKGVKTGGREKGTPNKLTKELRRVLKDLLHQELEKLPDHLDSLESKERLDILVKLMPYAMPKVEAIHYNRDEPNPFNWDFE
jgi:hypothetical protein